jgi:hypothetical protein
MDSLPVPVALWRRRSCSYKGKSINRYNGLLDRLSAQKKLNE